MRFLVWILASVVLALTLSGCIEKGSGPTHTAGWTEESDYGVEMQAVTLHDTIDPGHAKTWVFQVENLAPEDNPVEYDTACGGPFTVVLIGIEGRELAHSAPGDDCDAPEALVTLSGGDTLHHEFTWDGRIWHDGDKIDPRDGIYTLRIHFEGYHAGNRAHQTDVWGKTTVQIPEA